MFYGYSFGLNVVGSGTPPVNTVAPVISGTNTVGSTLSCTDGTWTGSPAPTYAYQWKRGGVNIGGATNSTYTLVSADGGTNITCAVTATNALGSASATSNTIAVQAQLLVDLYSPTAAFSIRKISSTATNCIRVRRSNDNAEQDIGFVGNDLDTASLASFVGANNAFVTTWYDQSGNGWDVVQTNAGRQPRIAAAGTIDSLGSHKSLNFANFYDLTNTAFATALKPYTAWVVGSVASGVYGTFLSSGGSGTMAWQHTDGYKHRLLKVLTAQIAVSTNTQTQNAQTLNGSLYDSSGNYAFYKNGAANGSGTNNLTLNATTDLNIGSSGGNSDYYSGEMQEVLLWTSDATANRTAIESNINTYYGIY